MRLSTLDLSFTLQWVQQVFDDQTSDHQHDNQQTHTAFRQLLGKENILKLSTARILIFGIKT